MDFLIPILNTLALAVALILLMVGLVEAPWQLLLFILVLATVVSQWLIRRSHLQTVLNELENSDSTTVTPSSLSTSLIDRSSVDRSIPSQDVSQPSQSSDSPLLYRGASYTPPQVLDASSDASPFSLEVSGKYRGSCWRSSIYIQSNGIKRKS